MTKLNGRLCKILSCAAAACMLGAFGFASGSTTSAHERYSLTETAHTSASPGAQDRDYSRYDRDDVARIARENGFRDGFRIGREDSESFNSYDPDDNPMYRRGDRGFRAEYGWFVLYRSSYQDAFLRGYRAGFRAGR